jgi:hypothetical protein
MLIWTSLINFLRLASDLMLSSHGVEALGNLFQFHRMALAMTHQNGLDKTVDISSLRAECLDRTLCRTKIVTNLL